MVVGPLATPPNPPTTALLHPTWTIRALAKSTQLLLQTKSSVPPTRRRTNAPNGILHMAVTRAATAGEHVGSFLRVGAGSPWTMALDLGSAARKLRTASGRLIRVRSAARVLDIRTAGVDVLITEKSGS